MLYQSIYNSYDLSPHQFSFVKWLGSFKYTSGKDRCILMDILYIKGYKML